jgi:hypothetical protein
MIERPFRFGRERHGQGKTIQLNIRISPWLKAGAADAAVLGEHRSLSSLIEKLLTDYCRERGFLKDAPKKRR